MNLQSDDDIYIVDQRWYGPPGKELPWHARYPAYGWGFVLYVLSTLIERVVLHIAIGFTSLVFTLLGVSVAITYLMRQVDPDRPLLSVLRGYWHELRTPRPELSRRRGAAPHRVRLSLSRPVSQQAEPGSSKGAP